MCGIAGFVGRVGGDDARAIVERMSRALRHRGPDDAGVWAADGVAIAVRRLSIIDAARGRQPMWTDDGLGIVHNGEVYNYRRIRQDLEADGYRFRTDSDTEVALRAYHRDGVKGLSALEGMFATCVVDTRARMLHLVRDRVGIKPLYWTLGAEGFFFASEIKAILAGLSRRPAVDEQAVHHYLTLRYVPGPDTIWRGIHKLPPGHRLSYDLQRGHPTISQYWDWHFDASPVDSERDYVGEFSERFLASVEDHLTTSDVPVGFLLSSGIDSSSLVAAATELGHRGLPIFTVGFSDGGEFNEIEAARTVARHVGAPHHHVVIGRDDFVAFLPELVRASDEPLADPASIPLFFVCRLAREHVKVVLSGEGSDETQGGYQMDQTATRLDQLRLLRRLVPAPGLRLLAGALSEPRSSTIRRLAALGWSSVLRSEPRHITRYWSEAEKDRLWRHSGERVSTDALICSWYDRADSPHPLDQMQEVYCRSWLPDDLLLKADRMSMANSLELRVPYLDQRLVEWVQRVPVSWRVGDRRAGYRSKRLVRAFSRHRLPPATLAQRKRGFPVPVHRWLAGSGTHWAEDVLLRGDRRLADILDVDGLGPLLRSAATGDRGAADRLWVLIVLEHWMRAWL